MDFEKINTKERLREWIKEELGAPCLHVEVTNDVIETKIDDAVKVFAKHSGDATYRTAMLINLSAGETEYVVDENIETVVNLNHDQGSYGGGIDTLFTPQNQIYSYDLGIGGFRDFGQDLISYQAAMEYIELSRNMLRAEYFLEYNKYTNTLKITPAATDNISAVLEVYSKRDFGNISESEIYDEEFIKEYALALTKIILGRIRSKFEGIPLPGGGSLDGSSLIAEGIEDRNKLKEDLMNNEGEPLEISVG